MSKSRTVSGREARAAEDRLTRLGITTPDHAANMLQEGRKFEPTVLMDMHARWGRYPRLSKALRKQPGFDN